VSVRASGSNLPTTVKFSPLGDLRLIHNQRECPERDVDLSPGDTVNNLRDLGFDCTVVVETDEDYRAD